MGVLLASAGFLLASVVSDIKHTLFTLVLIAMSYPIYLCRVKKRIPSSPEIPTLEEAGAEERS